MDERPGSEIGRLQSRRLGRQHWFRRLTVLPVGSCLLVMGAWIIWSESHPEQERELRVAVQERLEEWFPEEMALPEGEIGFIPRSDETPRGGQPDVVLVHGLDEPGGIWDDLVPALDAAGIEAWEFRYPNDQAIDHSADLLAEQWAELQTDRPVVLIGHSMGGLVIRDFVTRWRYPDSEAPRVAGAEVGGVILVGTPNHGSEWARFRVWLGLRDLISTLQEQEFSLFVALREGTGAAKVDLRPGSRFLVDLNARPWPRAVPIRLIGGKIAEPTTAMRESLEAISSKFGADELAVSIESWWTDIGEGLGDGVVPLSSLTLPEAPAPIVVAASHRGLLVRTPLIDEESEPPGIPLILTILEEWLER